MRRRPPRSTRTDTLFPYTTLFRSRALIGASGAPDHRTWGFPVGARLPIRRAQSQGREGPMTMTPAVKAILDNYESDNPGVKANLARILMQGRLGGTGKLIILPVDQGFEPGPARRFAVNPAAYDPQNGKAPGR